MNDPIKNPTAAPPPPPPSGSGSGTGPLPERPQAIVFGAGAMAFGTPSGPSSFPSQAFPASPGPTSLPTAPARSPVLQPPLAPSAPSPDADRPTTVLGPSMPQLRASAPHPPQAQARAPEVASPPRSVVLPTDPTVRLDLSPVMARLDALEANLREARPQPAKTPFWLILAILLLLLCQTVQFGLLVALLLWGPSRSTAANLPSSTSSHVLASASADASGSALGQEDTRRSEIAALPSRVEEPEIEIADPAMEAFAAPTPEPRAEIGAMSAPAAEASSKPAPARAREPRPTAQPKERPAPATQPKERPAPAESPSSGPASISVEKGEAYLISSGGSRSRPGQVQPGTYEVFIQADGASEYASVGKVSVSAGQSVVFRCGFGTCRRVK